VHDGPTIWKVNSLRTSNRLDGVADAFGQVECELRRLVFSWLHRAKNRAELGSGGVSGRASLKLPESASAAPRQEAAAPQLGD